MAVLREHFPECLISIMGNLVWPHRSPDLSNCYFYLWGYLKYCVYFNHLRNLQDLKANIQDEIANISADTLVRVMANA